MNRGRVDGPARTRRSPDTVTASGLLRTYGRPGRGCRRTYRPAALRSASTRSVRSQVKSGSSRPKWPYAAVWA